MTEKKCTTYNPVRLVISHVKWNFILILKLIQSPGGYHEKELGIHSVSILNDNLKVVCIVVKAPVRWNPVLSLSSCVILNTSGFSFSKSHISLLQIECNTYLRGLLWRLKELRIFSVMPLRWIYILKNAQKKKKYLYSYNFIISSICIQIYICVCVCYIQLKCIFWSAR